jgi:translation initiation factor IF-3
MMPSGSRNGPYGHPVRRFFEEGDKVKVTVRFRGREMAHQELGTKVLDKVKEDTLLIAKVESEPRLEGRQMTMVLAPKVSIYLLFRILTGR